LSEKFKAKPSQLIPEVLAIALAGLLTHVLRASNAPIEPITMFPETAGGVTLNATIFVVMMAAAGTFMYLFIKFGLKRIVRYLINFALIALALFLFIWYGSLYSGYMPQILTSDFNWIFISLAATVALAFAIFKSKGIVHFGGIIAIGGLTGTFLGVSIPTLTAIVLLLALAGYDLFAVYRGPIGKIAQSTDLEDFTGAVFTYGDLTVGMGDMVFYSMLASNAMMNFGTLSFFAAAVGLIIGAYLGFKMLEGRDMFPGLPFAIILGLGLMFLMSQIVTFLSW
jgi:presenilin-like A22 family membrane protease